MEERNESGGRFFGASGRERIGRFRILERLGGGGMGTVLLAQDERLGRQVALKLIHPERLFLPGARARFEREARVLSRLPDRGISEIYETGEVEGIPYLAMRYVPGLCLAEHLARARGSAAEPSTETHASRVSVGPSTAREVLGIVRLVERVARALHTVHEAGLVHRDVKPGNIMIAEDGSPVLLDFGLVQDRSAESLSGSGELLGTPYYMSPEQLEPRGRRLDGRSDVFSLGVVLYECLTLRRPFEAPARHATCERILHSEPLPPRLEKRRLGKDLNAVLARALEKDREKRYESAEAFAEDLRRIRDFEPVLARKAGPGARFLKWTRRNPAAASIVGILFVAALVIGLLYQEGRRNLWSFDRLAAGPRLRQAREAAQGLVPPWPEKLGEMRAWLAEHAQPLHSELGEVRTALRELEAGDENPFLRQSLEGLQAGLARFLEDPLGELARVRGRIAWAERVHELSIQSRRKQWAEACRSVRLNKRYGGLELRPQLGLVPLGPDPKSGLMEFAHLRSGKVATRDPATGKLRIQDETGLVFVLIPGGSFVMGSQKEDPNGPNYDPLAVRNESPLRRVELDAFFLSKYEMTRGQWKRLAGWLRPYRYNVPETEATMPVERVSWREADRLVRRLGLVLPTEAQWEYACRASTTTAWWTGNRHETLSGAANIYDLSQVGETLRPDRIAYWPDFDDGYAQLAAVDRLQPNGWGLHQMTGNVYEFCVDRFSEDAYRVATFSRRDGRQILPGHDDSQRVCRGGAANVPARSTRSADRNLTPIDSRNTYFGLRPARALRF